VSDESKPLPLECYVCGKSEPSEPHPVGWDSHWIRTPKVILSFCPRHRRERSKAIATLAEMIKR
jgi:hypothetical protein